jgi:hypothetical protein
VIDSCRDELMQKRLSKGDIEGFLSAMIYNAYGSTNAQAIAPLIFTDENYVAKKLSTRQRPNPPPADINADMDLYEVSDETIHNSRVKNVMKQIEEKVFLGPVKMY